MEELRAAKGLQIHQHKKWSEILLGFEAKSRYTVSNEDGRGVFEAEENSPLLLRWILQSLRPFTLTVTSPLAGEILTVKRPFRFFFHRVDVSTPLGKALGSVERKFAWVRRIYSVTDANGLEYCRLVGPFFHPWTFHVEINGERQGRIVKKWSGLLREGFTESDRFGAAFPETASPEQKALLLAAVFLIDFVHFERTAPVSATSFLPGD